MVKVLDKDSGDFKREERVTRLAEIARNILGKFSVREKKEIGFIYCKSENVKTENDFLIGVNYNTIFVKRKEYFDDCMRLARAYELRGEPEFTVKKEYIDD